MEKLSLPTNSTEVYSAVVFKLFWPQAAEKIFFFHLWEKKKYLWHSSYLWHILLVHWFLNASLPTITTLNFFTDNTGWICYYLFESISKHLYPNQDPRYDEFLWVCWVSSCATKSGHTCVSKHACGCCLEGFGGYFIRGGKKHGVNVVISNRNEKQSRPDTWMIPHEQYGDMSCLLCLQPFLRLRARPLCASVIQLRGEFFPNTKLLKVYVDLEMSARPPLV